MGKEENANGGETALKHANPELTERLIEAGADMNDEKRKENIRHSQELREMISNSKTGGKVSNVASANETLGKNERSVPPAIMNKMIREGKMHEK